MKFDMRDLEGCDFINPCSENFDQYVAHFQWKLFSCDNLKKKSINVHVLFKSRWKNSWNILESRENRYCTARPSYFIRIYAWRMYLERAFLARKAKASHVFPGEEKRIEKLRYKTMRYKTYVYRTSGRRCYLMRNINNASCRTGLYISDTYAKTKVFL